jgi:hypothetical protein
MAHRKVYLITPVQGHRGRTHAYGALARRQTVWRRYLCKLEAHLTPPGFTVEPRSFLFTMKASLYRWGTVDLLVK